MQCSTPIARTQYKIGRFHLILADHLWRAGLEWGGLGCGLRWECPTDLLWLPWQPEKAGDGGRGSRGGGRWRQTREGMDRRPGTAGSCGQRVVWPGRGSAGGVATHRTCGLCNCAPGRGRAGGFLFTPDEARGRVRIHATRVAVIATLYF